MSVVTAAALMLVGCATNEKSTASSDTSTSSAPSSATSSATLAFTDRGYTVPNPLPEGGRGDVILSVDRGVDPKVANAHRSSVLYHSQNSTGSDVAVSGAVFVPSGQVPKGGWPVISWAHGTVGVADRCAPSLRPNLSYDEYADEVRYFVESGYAVVATDYVGLGTPGTHTYMNQVDQGRAVADIVPAAKKLGLPLADSWFAVGHSQGGAAALTATRSSADAGLPKGLQAVVAVAPGNSLGPAVAAVAQGRDTTPVRQVYSMFLLAGASASDPAVQVSNILSDTGKQTLAAYSERMCPFDDPATFPPLDATKDYKRDPPDLNKLSAALDQYGNPDTAKVNGPISVISGTEDKDVPAAGTKQMIESLNRQGSSVTSTFLPKRDHDSALNDSRCQQLAFLAAHGGPTKGPQEKCPK